MRPHLPSLPGLRAFEAVARRKSFTKAALELNLTQTAVSHQVRKLESGLGVQLFVRDRHGTRLTDDGKDYLEAVRSSLVLLSSATERVMDRRKEERLSIVSLPAFGLKCLMPLLPEFRRNHPDIALRLDTVVTFDAAVSYRYDIAIRYGAGDWPGLCAYKIADEELFPVCSPALLSPASQSIVDDPSRHTLIRTASLVFRDGWPEWLDHAGLSDMEFADEITCDLMLLSVQAAIDGLGVVMGRTPLVDRDMVEGRLFAPFPVRIVSDSGYYITFPKNRAKRKQMAVFTDWLLGRFRNSAIASES